MRIRWIAYLAAAGFCLLPGGLYAGTVKLTIKDAVELAVKANYDVNMTEARLNELEHYIGEVRSGALPKLSGTAAFKRNIKKPEIFINEQKFKLGFNNEFDTAVSFSQTIYAAGKVLKAIKAAKSETMSLKASLNDLREEIKLQVKNTFNQILLAERTIEISKKTLSQMRDQLSAIKKRYNEGLESDYTLMRQEVLVSNTLPEISQAETSKVVLLNLLKVLLAIPEDTEIELVGRLVTSGEGLPLRNGLVEKAIANRQDLASKKAHIDALRYNVGIEKGGFLPSFSAVSDFSYTGQSDDYKFGRDERAYAFSAGLQLSWPIFDGLKTYHRVKAAKAELKIASLEEAKLRSEISSNVLNAYSRFEEAQTREKSQKQSLELAQKAVNIAVTRFGSGLMSQLELNDTILSRDTADKLYAQAVYDCLSAEAELARVVGK